MVISNAQYIELDEDAATEVALLYYQKKEVFPTIAQLEKMRDRLLGKRLRVVEN